jgi:putative membrane protein
METVVDIGQGGLLPPWSRLRPSSRDFPWHTAWQRPPAVTIKPGTTAAISPMKKYIAALIRHPRTKALFRPFALFLVLATASNAIYAQDASTATVPSTSATPAESTTLSHGDKKFVKKVARASTNEVALSQLADGHALSPDVKSFAQMMITDHTKANTDLGALATTKGIDISKAVAAGNTDDISSLSSKSGADFDKAYAKLMVSAHKGAVELFKDEIATGQDPDVVAFAKKYVDTLSMHLDHAVALEKTVNP